MLKSPTKSSKELYIDDYEILGCEPLHDITNIIQHFIEELPYHIENLEARNWYGSLFPLHKYNCNVLHVVDHTQIAELVHHH
jgi:hypothetical protein